jgi:hypothetical protein
LVLKPRNERPTFNPLSIANRKGLDPPSYRGLAISLGSEASAARSSA